MKKEEIVELSIKKLGKHGEGVAYLNKLPIFIDGALPNEKVKAKIILKKPSYQQAQLLSISHEHKERIQPLCSSFKECGGCQIMHLSYQSQLEAKWQLVKDAFKTINFDTILPCLASPMPFYYRNKLQLPVTKINNKIFMGFYEKFSHKIIPYKQCLIHHSAVEESVLAIYNFLQTSSVEPYCENTKTGTLRHILLRTNQKGEQLVGLITTGRQKSALKLLAEQIQSLKNIIGVVENSNKNTTNTILGNKNILLTGKSFLHEKISNLNFKISLPSFFQVNLSAAEILYKTALDFAELDKNSIVLDAYCGIGTLSLMAARLAKQVIGAECIEQAVLDAEENARLNKITNAQFVKAKIEEKVELFKNINIAFINPPRQGVNIQVINALNEYGPQRLVYISCNPHTLARDAHMLKGYKLIKIQPVDMFPQTMHIESVALLKRV